MTIRLLAQIAPQRSTQYADLAHTLAQPELKLCPLGREMTRPTSLRLAGQSYVQFELPAEPGEEQADELGMLAATSAFFVYYERLGRVAGPLLRPIETHFEPAFPPDMVNTRRYRGKTNELLTHFMCNLARFSSGLARRPWHTLRIFDPLAGGGTTLLTALTLGADAAGVERDEQDVESTAAFMKQYMREERIACQEREERLKKVGRRWTLTLGKGRPDRQPQQCLLACGDTADSAALISGFKPHLIVADLPYGIQHRADIESLLIKSLPIWAGLLPPGGAMVLAWESHRLPRPDMIALIQAHSPLVVLNDPPYNALSHRVDRVIQERDVLAARHAHILASSPDQPETSQ